MLQALLSTVLVIASFVGGFFGGAKLSENIQPPTAPIEQQMNVGAALPGGENSFETSLQSAISSSATSLTLTANSLRGGGTLSGFKCFTIDEGTASREDVCGTVSGTAVTSLTRGLSPTTATTTIAALQFAHRRGANVKITDFPLIQILRNQANGSDTYDNALVYTSHPTFTSNTQIVDKQYVDGVALAGAPVCSESVNGVCRLATKLNQASSTPSTASIGYVLQAQNATSTYNAGAAGGNGLNVVVTRNNNTIDPNFIDYTSANTWSGLNTFSAGYLATASSTHTATTSIAASSVTNNALVLNTVAYQFPSTQGASSTVLANNGSGVLTAQRMQSYATGITATTTGIGDMVIGHSLGGIPKMIKLTVYWDGTSSVDSGGYMTGTATSTDTATQNVIGKNSSSNASSAANYSTAGKILDQRDSNGGIEAVATLSAMTATTFTINFTTHSSHAKDILWEAYQ